MITELIWLDAFYCHTHLKTVIQIKNHHCNKNDGKPYLTKTIFQSLEEGKRKYNDTYINTMYTIAFYKHTMCVLICRKWHGNGD